MNPFKILGIIGIRSAFWYAVYKLELLTGMSKRRTPICSWDEVLRQLPEKTTAWNPDAPPFFFFDDPRGMGKILRRMSPGAVLALKQEFFKARRGSFRLWEDGWHRCGFPPQWNRNPLSGIDPAADCHWTDVEEQADGDIKGVWELSRFSLAFRLARGYAFTGEERIPELFWQLVESWLAANPPNAGPQWTSAQEVALRAMAWIFALRSFARSGATRPERTRKLIAALHTHASRIETTIAYARAQNNNHLISEAAALFTIGLMFPSLPRANRWRDLGRTLLAESAPQFFPDGGYIQHSHNYHRLALQAYLWVMRIAEVNGQPLPEELYRCVDRSFRMLSRMADPETGRVPNFGHNDGALFLPLTTCEYEDFRPLLQTISLWRKKGRVFTSGPWDEDAVWLLGPAAIGESGRASPRTQPKAREPFSAPDAGLFVLKGKESQAVIRCARFRSRPAHADQLHVDLWWRGVNVAADAGSYLYSGDPPWRNSLVHAAVHNTVTVDGKDQMPHSGRFLWTGLAQAEGEFSRDGRWQGTHDGYRGRGIIHRRLVERTEDDEWIVIDDLLGSGSHAVRLHWLIPDCPWEWIAPDGDSGLRKILSEKMTGWKDGSGAGLRLRTAAGDFLLRLWAGRTAEWSLYRAGKLLHGGEERGGPIPNTIRGWRSLRYASKVPALSIAGIAAGELPIRFISIWTPHARGRK